MENFDEEDENKHTISQDEKFLLASGVFKFTRLSDYEQAIRYAELLKRGTSIYYVARLLTQITGEDLEPNEYLRIFPSVRAFYEASKSKDVRQHDLWQLVYSISTATKWFQSEDGILLEKVRHFVHSGNKNIEITKPSFLLDEHTRIGLELKKQGLANLKLSGKWSNRYSILERWQNFVKENPQLNEQELKQKWILLHYQEDGGKNGETTKKACSGLMRKEIF